MNLNNFLDQSAAKRPSAPALVFRRDADAPEEVHSYGDLRRAVLRAASAFRKAGIAPGDRVAIVHRNDPWFVIAYFGLLRIGAVAVPINFLVSKAEELGFMFAHSGAKGVVTQREFLRGVREARKCTEFIERVWSTDGRRATDEGVEDFGAFVSAEEPLPAEESHEPKPDETVCLLYTSGTTGLPKAVMLTHSNLVTNVDSSIAAMDLSERDVALTLLPMFHTFAWTACVLLAMRLGIKNVVIASVTPPKPWLQQMARHGVTVFAAVPQLYAVLAKQACGLKRLALRYWFFRKVRIAVSGAAPLSPQTHKEFKAALGVEITEGYGLTETSPVATFNPLGRGKVGSVGVPIPDVKVKIVDDEGRELATGGEGEILIAGPNVMKGYFKNEEATREAITPDGWLKTGDVGLIDEEGYLHIRDRKKDMIIVKGLKVFSAQVEKVLLGHPSIQEAAIIGIPDASGDERIKAFVVAANGHTLDTSELHKFCRKHLDPYKRPRDIEILDELPKNALQKTLKRVLRDRELEKSKT